MSPRSPRHRLALRALVDAAALAAVLAFVASYFPVSLLFSDTTPNGGDMASHYYPAVYLREVLLPRGQLMGWCPGNYAGFPLFQFYFPLPFLLMSALSLVVPMTVAFKLVSVLGIFALPLCAYASLRLLRTPFPGPALGAVATPCFLFMEANSMWGGNIPSTLAGEFTFSIGFALAVLFVGTLHRTMESGRGWVGNGVLVALIGLCHGYALLWAGLVSLLELVRTRGWWRRAVLLSCVHGLAILLMAFWLFQLLGYSAWATAFNPTWNLQSWQEVLPPILWPATLLAALSGVGVGVRCWWRREAPPRDLGTLWAALALSWFFYATAHSFHVVDVRFMPFFQLGLGLAAAAGLGHLLTRLPAPEVWPLAGALATLPFVDSQVSFIPGWVQWNYSGFESKATWPVLRDLSRHLRGDFRDPRVVYEHNTANEAFGTLRVFENLPLFSGRSTLEGLYMQSSVTTPFVFYLQSEISEQISCPLTQWGCTRLDLDRGVGHLRMFNVSRFIVRSAELKQRAARHPELAFDAEFGPLQVYAVRDADHRYVVPLELAPFLVRTSSWKQESYQWFKRAGPDDPIPVFATEADSSELPPVFAGAFEGLPDAWPRRPLSDPPRLEERLESDRIFVTGARPGHPLLFRVSYHPRWRARTGERIWLAGPSFMLVVPKGERVELAFEAGPLLTAGRLASCLGLAVALAAMLPWTRRAALHAGRTLEAAPVIAHLLERVRATGCWSESRRRGVLAGGLAASLAMLLGFAAVRSGTDADTAYRTGLEVFADDRLDESIAYFEEAQRLAPLSETSFHARYFEALAYFNQEDWTRAEARFRALVENFPEARNAPEALYHVGLCRARLGDFSGAVEAWERTQRRFPESNWAKRSRERLAEIERGRE